MQVDYEFASPFFFCHSMVTENCINTVKSLTHPDIMMTYSVKFFPLLLSIFSRSFALHEVKCHCLLVKINDVKWIRAFMNRFFTPDADLKEEHDQANFAHIYLLATPYALSR
jgi:hypothetical protein